MTRAKSLPPGADVPLAEGGAVTRWFETVETGAEVVERTRDGRPVLIGGESIGSSFGLAHSIRYFSRSGSCVTHQLATLDAPAPWCPPESGLRVEFLMTFTNDVIFNEW